MSVTIPSLNSSSKPRRRWFRFSLRTLTLAITVLCVWLGILSYRANRQSRVVALIEAGGGVALYDFQVDDDGNMVPPADVPGPDWLRNLIGLDYFSTVRAVEGQVDRGYPVDEKSVIALADLSALRKLSLSGACATDSVLAKLGGRSELRQLDLTDTPVTDAGLEYLAGLTNLRVLVLRNDRITDAGLRTLDSFPRLEQLDVSGTQITDAGLKMLKSCSHLEELSASGTQIGDDGLEQLKFFASSAEFVGEFRLGEGGKCVI